MGKHAIRLTLMLLCAAMSLSAMLHAQAVKQAPAAESMGRDLSGVWTIRMPEARPWISYTYRKEEPPMTPWAEAQYKAAKPTFGPKKVPVSETNDPVYQCIPPGVPRLYLHVLPMEIVQVPGRVLMMFEHDHFVRQIWLDRTEHPADLSPTYLGDSIGHWEGNTLVVDTVGFNDKTWVDRIGHPHSEQLHVMERIRRLDKGHLEVDLTIEDPVAYTKPWGGKIVFGRHPTWHIMEHACVDYFKFLDFEKSSVSEPGK